MDLAPITRGLPFLRSCRVPSDVTTVTSVAADERDPANTGLAPGAAEQIWDVAESLYRWGMHPALAVAVFHDGDKILDRAIGYSHGNGPDDPPEGPRRRATPQTPFVVSSAAKSVTAMVVHLLDQRGDIHIDDRVCDYIPEFGTHEKDAITINHVLSHRAGVPNIPREALDLDRIGDPEHILAILCDAEPTSRPGRSVAYHAISGGFILAEVVRRVTGRTIRQVLADEILDPLGIEWGNYGVADTDLDLVAKNEFTGLPAAPPLSTMLDRALGWHPHDIPDVLNDPRFRTGVVPAANVVGTASGMARFFELLRAGGTLDGVHVFDRRTIRRAVSEQSYLEIDLTLGIPFRYGMGFMLGGKRLSMYGPSTEHAFGHIGYSNVLAWADPERRLAAAILTNGNPLLGPHLPDLYKLITTITAVCPDDGLGEGPWAVPDR